MGPLVTELLFLCFQMSLGALIFLMLFWCGVLSVSAPVLMYRGILLAMMAGCIQLMISILWNSRKQEPRYEQARISGAIAGAALAFGLNITFLIVFPVTIDRSVTVYLLGQLARETRGLQEAEMRTRLMEQYVDEYGAVSRRMREQIASGNVTVQEGVYSLTPQGQRFITFSRYVAAIFGADPKYIEAQKKER